MLSHDRCGKRTTSFQALEGLERDDNNSAGTRFPVSRANERAGRQAASEFCVSHSEFAFSVDLDFPTGRFTRNLGLRPINSLFAVDVSRPR